MSALEIRDLCKQYGETQTLKGIDIALESGEFLVLLGSSGCGKSTLLNIVAGLADPTSGDVTIDGRSILKAHPKDRDIAMVFQSYALYPNMTVARNIGFGLEMRKVPTAERDKAVRETAQLLQIENLLDRKPSQLSGGQRQRVAIGRALVRNPRVFLFDEPLSNLDARLRMEMRTELKRLHQILKTTVIYVTHDQIEAMTLATRIAVMKDGRIEQIGTPEEIYNRPETLYVAGFVGSPPMNILNAVVTDGGLRISGLDATIPLPRELESTMRQGQAVRLGIRPEALKMASAASDEIRLPARIAVVELTGPEKVVTASVAGHPVIACLPATAPASPDGECVLSFSPDALHIFDAATGRVVIR